MNSARRYGFNLPRTAISFGVIFFGALSGYMAHLARDLDGVIYILLVASSAIFAVLAFILITRRLVFPRVLELTDDAILFPRGFPRTRISRILYSDIIRMAEVCDHARAGLYFGTGMGSFEIMESYFSDIKSYKAARDFICSQASIVIPRREKQEKIWEEFPTPILHWVEPKDWPRYRTRLVTSKPLVLRLAKAPWFFVRWFGIFILPWLLLQLFQLPTSPAVGYFCLSAVIALFFTLLHWLNAIWPVHSTEISFREKGITQFFGKQEMDWNYHDFSGWAVIERQFEERVLHILLLKSRARVVALALPDTNTREGIVQIFHDKQIPHSPDLRPSWELP